MLLRLIKTNRKAGSFLFALLILGICLIQVKWPHSFPFIEGEENYVFFGLIYQLLKDHLLLSAIVVSLLLLINGLVLFRIYRKYLFPSSWSMLPGILFVLLTAGMPEYETLHPVWFAMVFFIFGIDRIFLSFDIRKPYNNIFIAGFFLSLGSLFYFNLLLILPAFIMGGRIMARDAGWREPFLVFLGSLVPWIFVFSIYFLLDNTAGLVQGIDLNFLTPKENILKNVPALVFLGILGLLTIAGSFTILKQYAEEKVKFRRFFLFFFLLFISAVLSFLLVPAVSFEIFILAAVPVTFLLSNYFESFQRFRFVEIVFALIIGFVIFLQLYFNGQNIIN